MSETTVAIAVWDGVEELDVVGPYEVLSAWAAPGERPADPRLHRRRTSR